MRVWTDEQGLESYEAKDKMGWAEVQQLLSGEEATGYDELAGEWSFQTTAGQRLTSAEGSPSTLHHFRLASD